MPLKKIQLKPGVNKENTRYTTEGGWYSCDKVRFRQGSPEKIGGWQQLDPTNTFLGVCRSLWPWDALLAVGTHLKFYIMFGGAYFDITPIRATTTAGDVSFSVVAGSNIMTVADTAHGCDTGDFVTFSSASGFAGNVTAAVINQEYQVTVIDVNTYTVTLPVVADVYNYQYLTFDFLNGIYGAWTTAETAIATYQINVGIDIATPLSGWGAGPWGFGTWGVGTTVSENLRIWNIQNFGDDLIFGPKDGALYYWDQSSGLGTRGVALNSLTGASDVPTAHRALLVSDTSRFVLAFGCNDYGSADQNLMLIRWSDQESAVNWTPAATNQAGSLQLSHGTQIVGALQVRQEILVWTDIAMYSLQYLGPPIVWGSQLLADNVTLASDRAMATAAGVTYWMGDDKFYMYDGRAHTLPCNLRRYVFNDFNYTQSQQVFASSVEQFDEIWWFYCSASNNTSSPDKYVVYNYTENVWYYGSLSRTAWIDASVISQHPIAATGGQLLYHELGCDDKSSAVPAPIEAFITSSEFDIDDGNNFAFVWRVLPDVTFDGSTASNPRATLTLLPLQNSGSGYNVPPSVAGADNGDVVRSATAPVEQFTGQVNIRVRGRQMSIKLSSDELGVAWQFGSPRLDIRLDGRKS